MAFAQSDKQKKQIEKSVLGVMNTQVAAWNKGDIDGFMEGCWKSEKMTFVSGNNVSFGWQAALDNYKKGYDSREKMGTLSFSEIDVMVLSKEAAYVRGRWTLKREKDKPTGLFTLIFRDTDDGWKVVHDHTSS